MSKETAEAKAPGPKYSINDLATALGREPASVRVSLRNSNLKKTGARWGWNTKSELDDAVKALKTDKPSKTDKPAKASKAEKPAKSAKKPKKSEAAAG